MADKTKKSKKKIVSVKKLSRFYKKTYTTDSFEKKILQKLFIESDKNLVSKLFITKKDKNNRNVVVLNQDLTITKTELTRCKKIAKEIKAQKGGIKLVPLAAAACFFSIVVILFCSFKNIVIRKAITNTMQKTFGARTDIDYLNFNLFDAQLDIRNLAQADKEYPMTNLFSIDSVKIDLNLTDLLRGKFHTENITVDGVALDTPRTISGELPEKTKKSSGNKKVEKKSTEKQNELLLSAQNQLNSVFENFNPEKMLTSAKDELKSPEVAKNISTDVQEKVKKWQSFPSDMKKSVDSLSSDFSILIKQDWSKVNDPIKIASTIKQIKDAVEKTKELQKTFETTVNEIAADSKVIEKYDQQLKKALNDDKNLIDKKIGSLMNSFSSESLNNVMNDAVQSILYNVTGKYYPYISKLINYAESSKSSSNNKESATKNDKKTSAKKDTKKNKKSSVLRRAAGRNIFYRGKTPSLLIEKIDISGYEYKTNNLLFKGTASDITNDMELYGKPAVATAWFNIHNRENDVKITIDSRKNTNNPIVSAAYTGKNYPINANAGAFSFDSKSEINAKLDAFDLDKYSINGILNMNLSNVKGIAFEPAVISKIYNTAISGIKKLNIDFNVDFSIDDGIAVKINNIEDISRQLVSPISKSINAELTNIASDAKKNISVLLTENNNAVNEQISKFYNINSDIKKSNGDLTNIQKQLNSKLAELSKSSTTSSNSKAADMTKDMLKKLF